MDYFSGWCKSKRRLEGLTAIVTGSNTGIGKETAHDFYLRGARVIMACRDMTKAEKTKKELQNSRSYEKTGSLVVEKLDLSSLKSVREFAFKVLENEPKIHILVNNAGIMCCPQGKTEDGFETHMGTNHFGHSLLTLLLLPRLRKSAPARIVFVSSYMHMSGEIDFDDINYEKTRYDPIVAYSKSKSANLLFSNALARKLKEHDITDVTTYSLHPGVINTELGRYFSDTIFAGATWVWNNVLSWFLKSPRCGAQTTIYCAVDEACANQSGLYYSDCAPISPGTKHCQDEAVADKLWDVTIDLLELTSYDPFTKADPDTSLFNN